MDAISAFFSSVVFVVRGEPFTVAELLLIPSLILLGWWFLNYSARRVIQRMESRRLEANHILLFRRLYYTLGVTLLVFTILALLKIPLTAFAFVSGALAIAAGFGAQNILNNFISGWILIWEKPIRVGDFLELEGVRGTVVSINTRSTLVRRIDGVHLLVPNSRLLENTVINWTLVDRMVRSQVRVGVAYGSPVEQVADLIRQAANSHEEIMDDPEPRVIFEDFGDNALIFDLYFWVDSFGERSPLKIRSDVRFAINRLLTEHGITIAFPQRDVHLDGHLVLRRESSSGKTPATQVASMDSPQPG